MEADKTVCSEDYVSR